MLQAVCLRTRLSSAFGQTKATGTDTVPKFATGSDAVKKKNFSVVFFYRFSMYNGKTLSFYRIANSF